MNNQIVSVKNLIVKYATEKGEITAVDNVSFNISSGSIFGIVGESGSGKSTLVQTLLRTLPPPGIITNGEIRINNMDVLSSDEQTIKKFRWRDISIVMQSAMNALNPVLRIHDQLADVIQTHSNISKEDLDKRVEELLFLVDIDSTRSNSYPHQLSGGMKQRIVIAIALALMPPVIIMDEPTTALDVIIERDIIKKVIELRKEFDFTILFITHDLNLLLEFADNIAVMKDGQIVELDNAKSIRSGGHHQYTKALISALPSASGPRDNDLLPQPESKDFGNDPIIEIDSLTKIFSSSSLFNADKIIALDNVSFKVYPGEILGLVGESGSGKSTIAKIINGLDNPTSGGVYFNDDGKIISGSNQNLDYHRMVQMVFQDPFGSLNAVHTVYHHLSRPLIRHKMHSKENVYPIILEILENIGLTPGHKFAEKFPHEMSGGERQRVAIARALSLKPKLIVADEPTSMLDVSIRMEILEIFARLRIEKDLTIIFITHDLASARYLADRIIVLQNGRIIEEGESEKIIQRPNHEYTKKLVKAASPGWLEKL